MTAPATAMQEALWWVHQRARNKSVYTLTWRMGCDRPVNRAALAVAWQAVVDRHDALRTAVTMRDGAVELTIAPTLPAGIHQVDAESGPDLLRLLAEEVHEQPIDLERPPLARLTVVRVGDQHELLLTVHHIVLDGWANQLLVNDLSVAYSAACAGRRPEFAGQAASFRAYAEQDAAARAGEHWRKSLDHWRRTLDGVVSTTVAADRRKPSGVGAPGATVRYALSDDAVAGINALTRTVMATPFVAALAALQIVLARGGAGPDVALGVVVANRMTQRDQELVGYTANLCVAAATVSGTIADVVVRARDSMWAMLAHQSTPYPVLFGALTESAQAMLGHTVPLLLDYLGPIGGGLALGDVDLVLHRAPNRAARADIVVVMWDDGQTGYMTEIEYNTARYDRATVLRLLEDVDTVLSADVTTPVAELDVVTRSVAAHADQGAQPGASEARWPSSPVAAQVASAWERVLGEAPVAADEDFFAQGGRSLKVLHLAAAVQAETGTELDLTRWLAEPTPARLVEQLTAADPGDATSTVVVLRRGTGPHLHLVPGAGGGPHDYRTLVDALPDGWQVTASQERRPLTSVPAMAAAYLADLDDAGIRPDLLAGWSLGGVVAFEMARGRAVPLALLDPAPPVGYDQDVGRFDAFAATVCAASGTPADLPRVHGDDNLRIAALAAYLSSAGQGVPASLLADQWHAYRRHLKAMTDYVPSSGISVPALVVAADLLDSQVEQWAGLLGPVRRIRVDTDHFGVLRADAALPIAAALRALTA